ncbi:MAG: acyl-CoA/acyl-ACP dehydrogenase [Deltaproteobacteria bacterium]|nr:acyl-CoA/acyl-ACP dehydrogenase [Deltaproteobacteria bacterium]
MDFSLSDEQKALAELAGKIIGDHAALERLKKVEGSDSRYDRDLWLELAKAGLLGAALPDDVGGSGGGFVEMCLLLEQQGKRVAMVPLLSTIVAAALPLAQFGSAEQKSLVRQVLSGDRMLTAALVEPLSDPRLPSTTATAEGKDWRLKGVKLAVPLARHAERILVPARTGDGKIGVFLLDPKSSGVRLTQQEAWSWEPQFIVELNDVKVDTSAIVGALDSGAGVLNWIIDRTMVGLCAIASGACQEALRITAEYTSNRKQFDKPIAMFQAVGQRMADSFIDNEGVNLTMWQAASRLADDMPSDREIATAKYWAAEGGSRIGHAALHLHGGICIDVDYPIHRYFLWLKQIENTLGGATPQLERLGKLIAAQSA